ncbi:hypothetical protein C9374_004999 [Naegleria lovaniensis]|uniref:Transcription initiation factor TFIID component TAF4 C-terminal domain-containing protein n=1 Tax=Naegleria lovaniensis TaxID=51637 RepID=A0AA88GRJ4_NAELO|nr:uncharacterized protein C9374_004999 [Naegleria lovaniensis]KAG2383032.1 hypothetical protein C9374_004999 [Naegleria lovaniensis]
MNPPNNPSSSSFRPPSSSDGSASSSATGQQPGLQQTLATTMTLEKIQKLREKVEALKMSLTDDGKKLADRIVDQFQRGAFDATKLSLYVKELKARYSLQPQQQQQQQQPVLQQPLQAIPAQQPIPQQLPTGIPAFGAGTTPNESMLGLMMGNPLLNQQQPPPQRLQSMMQQPLQAIPSQQPLPPTSANIQATPPNAQQQMPSFTDEERQLVKQIKEMTTEERKEYVKRNPAVLEILARLKSMQMGGKQHTVVKTENEPMSQQLSNQTNLSMMMNQQPNLQQLPTQSNLPNGTPGFISSAQPSTMDSSMQPPPKKKKSAPKHDEEMQIEETPFVHTFTNDEEVHSVYTSRYQPEPSFCNSVSLKNKLNRIVKSQGLKGTVSDNIIDFVSLAVQDRMRTILEELIANSKLRMDTPINASENVPFVEFTSSSNAMLVQKELKIKKKILQEEELRREEEKKKQASSSEGKKKRTSKEDDEQRNIDMNEAIGVALGKRSSSSKSSSASSSMRKSSSTTSMSSARGSGNKENDQAEDSDSVLGKRSIVIIPQDVLLFLEQEPQLRKSKLLHALYARLKE